MSQHVVSRRLRLHLFIRYHQLQCPVSRRSLSAVHRLHADARGRDVTNDYKRRVAQLKETNGSLEQCYPRLDAKSRAQRTSISAFRTTLKGLLRPTYTKWDEQVVVAGRVNSVRTAGNKLIFIDLKQGDETLQVMCQFDRLDPARTWERADFKALGKSVRKGDWYQVRGWPHRSQSEELSVLALELPQLLSPSLHQVPDQLDDAETRAKNRHVEMLVDPSAIQTLRVRHMVEQQLNDFFARDGFTKVNTPILSAGAGGAIARPFETEATELEGQKLNLRIAPELWLKRLVVGGMEKVYEIGPAFRNEGVDATHNPEFYICEFYEAFAKLEDLMRKTEKLLRSMAEGIESVRATRLPALDAPKVPFQSPFQRLEFIPTLQNALNTTLPDLSDPESAQPALVTLFQDHHIEMPANPTLPRLLDALAAQFIEPFCTAPTFMTHHPTCLSPLSKHTVCPTTGQQVALRAELFIDRVEYANMYEEENSPFAQRQKFEQQLQYRRADGEGAEAEVLRGEVDESYLAALEWGLPPTGGWGCGIERLVMLFAGSERIGDVLAFGGLRNVVGLGSRRRTSHQIVRR